MIGERLGKWVLYKEIGRGGMGRVYLAQEEIGGRQAAIKILAAELAQQSGFLERFQREIETLSKLEHANIVRFYEAGFENHVYFYAMEYVEGDSLEMVLAAKGKLPWPEVLDIALQICPALRHVHASGVIHRDLKPANILRTLAGQIKLTDFGVAKVFAATHLTATGGVVGTAEFLSPEQASGKPLSKRSDLYSLGCVLYTLLIGRPPFMGENVLDLLHKHRYAQFDKPGKILVQLPYEIDEVVCQLLEKDPEKRPADAFVLQRQLERIRGKLQRKEQHTQAETYYETIAENESSASGAVGPGTLMSRLMRQELDDQNRPHPVAAFFNRASVLAILFALCVAILVWTFWPLSAETLYQRGAALMASGQRYEMETAWRDYLQPLTERFPDHPHQKEVEEFRRKLDHVRAGATTPSEAEQFFEQGERLRREGQMLQAKQVWENVVRVFKDAEAEQQWVRRSEQALADMEKTAANAKRWEALQPALKRAAALRDSGQRQQAEKIWSAIEDLYKNDPWAAELVAEIEKARAK